MEKLLMLWVMIKEDWEKTVGRFLWDFFFVAFIGATIIVSFVNAYYGEYIWFIVGIWQLMFLIQWITTQLSWKMVDRYRELCDDLLAFNEELLGKKEEELHGKLNSRKVFPDLFK